MAGLKYWFIVILVFAPAWPQDGTGGKAPKPKSRMRLLQQLQNDLDTAVSHGTFDAKSRKKADHCHEVLIDAMQQQQRYKNINKGKVNGCLKDIGKLSEAGVFQKPDAEKLSKDADDLEESIGNVPRFHLPKSL
jgi:hypothetical protein